MSESELAEHVERVQALLVDLPLAPVLPPCDGVIASKPVTVAAGCLFQNVVPSYLYGSCLGLWLAVRPQEHAHSVRLTSIAGGTVNVVWSAEGPDASRMLQFYRGALPVPVGVGLSVAGRNDAQVPIELSIVAFVAIDKREKDWDWLEGLDDHG